MTDNLPPLPEPTAFLVCKGSEVTARAWNCDEMQAYARAALAQAQSLPDGWVMLDKNGVVHRYKWKRIDFFGSVDDSGTAFTLGEIEYEAREWAGLAPFTVRPVSFMAPVLRHWPMEEQPDGTVIPVDPSELIAAPPAQPVQPCIACGKTDGHSNACARVRWGIDLAPQPKD